MGAVTVLVVVVAVFLSYNANAGLPFVPTYPVKAEVPDASGLTRGNEVRIGGKRVGIVEKIGARTGKSGDPIGVLNLKLDLKAKPLRSDTRVTVRPLSPLGLKYLELKPGVRGRPLRAQATLPLTRSTATVELDEVLNTFDDETRRATQVVTEGLGAGLAGRGASFNELLRDAPPLLRAGQRVAENLSDRRTRLDRLASGLDATVSQLDSSRSSLGPLVEGGDTTLGALASQRERLGEIFTEAPSTETAGTRALRAVRPVLRDAEVFLRDARPGLRVLRPAAVELDRALDVGTPVLRRATGLAGRLTTALRAVDRLARDPSTRPTLEKLRLVLVSALPTVRYVAPMQTQCNYLGLWTRNVPSTISEGDNAGTWFRTLLVQQSPEQFSAAEPSPSLHVNPYANSAAPGQDGECEGGNEPYLEGTRIGNVPGNQGRSTESTSIPAGTPKGP